MSEENNYESKDKLQREYNEALELLTMFPGSHPALLEHWNQRRKEYLERVR